MKQMVSRWLLPLVLVFGLVGNSAAGKDADDGPTKVKEFKEVFVNDAGKSFGDSIKFKVDGEANLITLDIFTHALSELSLSIFDKKSKLSVYEKSFDDGVFHDVFSLDPGKYRLEFEGSILGNFAGYGGALSASAVPEPAEWMMILAGVAMMGFVVSRRRNG